MTPTPAQAPAARTVDAVLPWPPPLNRLYRTVDGHPILSAAARSYSKRVALLLCLKRPLDGPVEVELWAYRPRRAGDIDGPLKLLLDVLQGALYHDDKQIEDLIVHRRDDKRNPRVEVIVRPANGRAAPGLFAGEVKP